MLSGPFSLISGGLSPWGWFSPLGVTSPKTRRENTEPLTSRFNDWETEACRWEVTCLPITKKGLWSLGNLLSVAQIIDPCSAWCPWRDNGCPRKLEWWLGMAGGVQRALEPPPTQPGPYKADSGEPWAFYLLLWDLRQPAPLPRAATSTVELEI